VITATGEVFNGDVGVGNDLLDRGFNGIRLHHGGGCAKEDWLRC